VPSVSFVRGFPVNFAGNGDYKRGKKIDERLSRDALNGEIKFKRLRLVSWQNGHEVNLLVRRL
jgi:hypothetical protein